MWFENWETIIRIIITSGISFIALVFLIRTAGKRTLTKMNAFDFIMTYAIGSTLATIITSKDTTIASGVTALGMIIGLQYVTAWLVVRFEWFQQLVKSRPTIIYDHEGFHMDEMVSERITKQEVMAAIRQKGYSDLSQIDLVLLETNGLFSVIPKRDGQVGYDALVPAAPTQHK